MGTRVPDLGSDPRRQPHEDEAQGLRCFLAAPTSSPRLALSHTARPPGGDARGGP